MSKLKIAIAVILVLTVIAALHFLQRQKRSLSDKFEKALTQQSTNSGELEGKSTIPIETSTVTYSNSTKGFFAKPKDKGNYPGVVMIHEWWGLNDNIKEMAKNLSGQGYMVLAVDLFNDKVAKTPTEATALISSLNQNIATDNLKSAVIFLKNHGATKTASLGWCFGGGQSLELSLSGVKLDATVIYYGNLQSDKNKLAKINWPVLGIFGDKDQTIPVKSVKDFENSLESLDIVKEIYIYPGVGHAFANPSNPNFAPDETKDAWDKTLVFLEKSLKQDKKI